MKGSSPICLAAVALGCLSSNARGDDPGPILEDVPFDTELPFDELPIDFDAGDIPFDLDSELPFSTDLDIPFDAWSPTDVGVEAEFLKNECVLKEPKDCIDSDKEFEKKLKDKTTVELILCDGFKYKAHKAFDLSYRKKKVLCAGKCVINGYHFTHKKDSWITVNKVGYQEWCGVTFDYFKGKGVSATTWGIPHFNVPRDAKLSVCLSSTEKGSSCV